MKFRLKYAFLSNFHPCEVEYEGVKYPTAEHAFQASKTMIIESREEIAKLESPASAKHAGHFVPLRPDWEQVKLQVMLDILRIKFQNPRMRDALIGTNGVKLIEENEWNDTFWGVCNGRGQNHLGKLLMQVRSELCG